MTDLPPGRELDALVAEKVMGWKRYTNQAAYYADIEKTNDTAFWVGPDGVTSHNWYDGSGDNETYFDPSTDIADAWPVLEKMRAQLPGQEIMLYYCDGWGVGSLCQAPSTIEIGDHYGGDALTAPHAICLAALELVK